MSRALKRGSAVMFLAVAATVFASSCAPNESSIYVVGCLAPESGCSVKADPTSARRLSGTLDAAFGGGYACPLLVANQLVARGDPDRLRTETSKIQIERAEVRVIDPVKLNGREDPYDDSVLIDGPGATFSIAVSGFLNPSVSGAPGFGSADVTMISAPLAAALGARVQATGAIQSVVVDVVIHGRTLGGIQVESWHWYWPVDVCWGCLCNRAACVMPDMNATDMPAAPCAPGMDDVTDCRTGLCQ